MPKKAAAKKKSRVDKPYNAGTMSESAFFGMIREGLRQKSRWWKPILNTKKAAQIPYTGTNKRRKYSYLCSECGGEFDAKQVVVHHIVECGSLRSFEDLPGFAKRLFCEQSGLQLICKGCHDKKHGK